MGLELAGIKQLERPDYALAVAGLDLVGGPGGALAQHRVKRGGPAPLELTGYLSDRRLDSLLTDAALVVQPSLYEGFGLVVLEAMARGTPVLAARAGALPQTGGEAAAYFDPADPDSLSGELSGLLADPAVRAQMSEAGVAWASGCSWPETARRTAAVYRELL